MGLDQYAMVREKGEEVMYWRKHNRLQGWMEDLYYKKTGKDAQDFNCADLRLEAEDIDNLEEAVESKKLPKTEGFFYGTDTYEEDYEKYYKKDDLTFIKSAREAIKDGKEVIYTCWW